MKVLTIIGARPQFIKAAMINNIFNDYDDVEEIILHTGQHYDFNMSDVFFEKLNISEPKYNLSINGLSHSSMTGRMLEKIGEVIEIENPDWVLVYGDTNSTLAGALAAKQNKIKLAHVEAGLRSFNFLMPEETNRVLTDRISDVLFCPTELAVQNLKNEGFSSDHYNILNVGDVMYDVAINFCNKAESPTFNLPDNYLLFTLHREENTNNITRLKQIINAINHIHKDIHVVCVLHPRTKFVLLKEKIKVDFQVEDPVDYFTMLYLMKNCLLVLTDSGGIQKEAFFFSKKCITLRKETEWVELVKCNYNILVGSNQEMIKDSVDVMLNSNVTFDKNLYGNGNASEKIVKTLIHEYKCNR